MDNNVKFTDGFPSYIDADYQVTAREQTFVSRQVYEVVRMKSVTPKVFPTVPLSPGAKTWVLNVSIEQSPPVFDDDFLTENQDESRVDEKTFYPVFMHKDYKIRAVDEDSSQNQQFHDLSLSRRTLRDLAGLMVDYKEKVIWRGYDISGRASAAANPQGSIDTSVLGILNTSGIGDFEAGVGGDSIIAAAGDAVASLSAGIADLVDGGFYGPYDMFVSPLVYKQFIANINSTTHLSDLQGLLASTDANGSKLLRGFHISKHLIGSVETTTTSNITLIDRMDPNGNPTILLGEGYPIASHPHRGGHAMAQEGVIIWSGVAGVIQPTAITQDAAVKYA